MLKLKIMANKAKNQKLVKLLADLNSADSKKITTTLKALEAHGDVSVIKPLADKLLSGVSDSNKKEIVELLSSLKDSSVCSEIMDIIGDEKYLAIRQVMLSTIWNTKINYSDYIDDFVQIATEGTLLEALDCLTIIENLEGPFMEECILECQLHLKNYLEKSTQKDDGKAMLMSEIALFIKDVNEDLWD